MALTGELVNYIGGELVKNTGKELASKATTSALSNLIPKLATNATNSMARKIGNEVIAGSMLGKLVPKNRMLDKSGKPVTLYHSTPNDFDKFDDAMLGSNTGYDNTALGHFVTPDIDFSKRFIDIDKVGKTGRTMELQGNIQKPILHPYFAGAKYKDPAVRDKIVENYLLATDNQEGLKMLRDMADEDALEFGGDANLYNEYMALADDPGGGGPFEFAGDERELLKKKGYDAVEIVEGPKSGLVEGAKSNEPVSSYAVFSGENLRPVRHIPVEGSSSLSSIIPVKRKLYRGQQYSNTDFSYNSELMNENPDKWGSKDVGKGYHFTPKKGMAGSWEGSDGGVIEVDYTPDQVLKADDARKMIKEANELLADDKYMAKLWQENEVMAEQIEKIADGNLEALAKREGKPFVQHLKANDDELGTMYYYKDIDPELTDRFVSEFKQKAEKYMPKRASANGDDMVTLFHNTKAENIPSIMEQGLIPGKRPEGYLASPEEAGIWTDDRGLKSGSYGGTTVKIRVPKKEFDATRVNDTQNLLNRAIKPSEIEGVDYMLYDTPLIKNSNLQEYIDKYGEDKVRELIEKKALVSPEVIDKSFSDLKSGRSLTKPNIQQSKDVYSSLINKAKNYKSLDRFEKMNNPIKGSEIWGEKPKSYFERDSRAVRINMFPNEAVKGSGITKQYLLNLLKDAYDQGITDIVPSYGSYTKEGASFMDHLAEQGWVKANGKNGWNSYEIAPKIAEWEKTSPLADIYNKAHNVAKGKNFRPTDANADGVINWNDVKSIYAQAEKQQKVLDKMARSISEKEGYPEYQDFSPKSIESMENKVARKGGDYSLASMKDHTRNKIMMNSWNDVGKTINDIAEVFGGTPAVEYVVNDWGYKGLHITGRFDNGLGWEIQLTTPEDWPRKLRSDAIYDKWRNVKLDTASPKEVMGYLNAMRESNTMWAESKIPDLSMFDNTRG